MSDHLPVLVEKLNECKEQVRYHCDSARDGGPERAVAWATLANAYARIIAATCSPVGR